ncbi:MAG: hypothetical protein JKY19_13170 [Alcanivoracaceae bacterium]|nr:hypothetical protein [Alcanivoracaceae bacterium]
MKNYKYIISSLLLICSFASIAQSLLNKQQLKISSADIELMKSSGVNDIIKISGLSDQMKFKKIELYNENTHLLLIQGFNNILNHTHNDSFLFLIIHLKKLH